jgi:hypothetical protein
MTGLHPSCARAFTVEVKTTVATQATIARPRALEGRLGRPGEGALLRGKARLLKDDLFHFKQRVSPRISMVVVHGKDAKGGSYVCLELAACGAHGQESARRMMRKKGY